MIFKFSIVLLASLQAKTLKKMFCLFIVQFKNITFCYIPSFNLFYIQIIKQPLQIIFSHRHIPVLMIPLIMPLMIIFNLFLFYPPYHLSTYIDFLSIHKASCVYDSFWWPWWIILPSSDEQFELNTPELYSFGVTI